VLESSASPALPDWTPALAQAVAASVGGNATLRQEIEEFLPQIESHGWLNLAAAVRRILNGESNAAALCAGLDDMDSAIVHAILDELSGQASRVSETREVSEGDGDDDHPDAIPLDQFLDRVGQACRAGAPAGLGEQLYTATLGMAQQTGAAPEINALGRILNAILCGERQPDLAALPAPLAAKVQGLLASL
jgi:hypothetical protein